MAEELIWYVAYGSNLSVDRFGCYVSGGRPAAGIRSYPGFRDPTPPRESVPVRVPGCLYFAGQSRVWTGGTAYLDTSTAAGAASTVAGRAYLISAEQFADLAEQEMLRSPGAGRELSEVLATGRHEYGPGRYETLLLLGERDGLPMLTVSSPWTVADAELAAPTAAYLGMIGRGLIESHGCSAYDAGRYLADAPGAVGSWDAEQIAALLR